MLQRLNHLMLLHIHKNRADDLLQIEPSSFHDLDLIDVVNDFINGSDHRKNFFGSKFKHSDRD